MNVFAVTPGQLQLPLAYPSVDLNEVLACASWTPSRTDRPLTQSEQSCLIGKLIQLAQVVEGQLCLWKPSQLRFNFSVLAQIPQHSVADSPARYFPQLLLDILQNQSWL